MLAQPGERAQALKPGLFLTAYLVSAGLCCVLAATGQARFTDLHVYRLGGDAVLHGLNLYQVRHAGLPFTYAPFAAVCFVVLTVLPWAAAAALLTIASAAALPFLLYAALRLPAGNLAFDRATAGRLALACASAAIWLEPARTTLGYGQIDLLLAAAVLADLGLAGYRSQGLLTGLCAGLKLTPAIFIVYLLLTRRFRAAATATAAFAATVLLGFLIQPASSELFWNVTFVKPARISPVQNPENQSLLGVISRNLHTTHVVAIWLLCAVAVGCAGLAIAVRAQRRGHEALGFSICAVTGLLISPISWTHHWVIAIPALLIAAVWLYRHRAGWRRSRLIGAWAGLGAVAVAGWLGLARQVHGAYWLHLNLFHLAESELYVVAGLSAVAVAVMTALVYRDLAERAGGKCQHQTPALIRPTRSSPDRPRIR